MPDERKLTAEEMFREHPERFDHGDIEPDEKRNTPGMAQRVRDGVDRLKKGARR